MDYAPALPPLSDYIWYLIPLFTLSRPKPSSGWLLWKFSK